MVRTPAPPGPTPLEEKLLELAGAVPDPELPVVTLAELGVLRGLHLTGPGRVEVELTPTYTGCPAVEAMAADIERVLHDEGIPEVQVRTVLTPAWSTDDITPEGRRKLGESGVAPPRPGARTGGPVALALGPTRLSGTPREPVPVPAPGSGTTPEPVRCPHCGSADTTLLSRFSSTACKALRRCGTCHEPFDHFKEL
ncbi:1,2-phenylacetyl-CoA epoxidase subunit PaaD [Streptomyces sp. UNOC14_S4]|uniref:1,2-phenylacetyl-CoA epoxidase subunit PaaD n=1 Tax=Streptomyces sp. UNOC14_S4 TaxID=2872340 RepID=UPI001E46B911|nr:1,2-phenylacetyl-CoA epoxidase subunit PaaD [Streptomyces sp. UNOC14_S4]MCC3768975.1 phenylacetate-CoA oxygenase subunit PaaJ [Streptomyces sp. UNOC14_S4]